MLALRHLAFLITNIGLAAMVVASEAHMKRKGTRRKRLHLFFCCSAFLIFLHKTPTCAFGRPKQELASEFRERTGHSSRRKVKDVLGNAFSLSREEKQLLTQISIASDRRSWQDVQSRFVTYSGKAPQIYNAAMNAALRCLRYDEGASIYQKCRETCERFEEATFTSALRIFAKLGKPEKVREIWDEAQKECTLTHMLVASRIHAAAVEGNVETAASMLDLLNTNKLEINEIVLTSAIKSCWGWGTNQHRAAKYFWNLFAKFNAKPDVAAFAALMGAYKTAPLKDILSAKAEMEELGIKPVFASHIKHRCIIAC